MRRSWTSALLALLVLAGCGGGNADVALPALDDAEPLVAERIRAAADALRSQHEQPMAWGRLAAVLDINGFPREALPAYERAMQLDPQQWRWPYYAGLALRKEDAAAARTHLQQAAKLQSSYPPLQFHLGLLALEARQLDEAQSHFEQALAADPRMVNALLGLARVAVRRKDPDAALQALDRAAALAPEEAAVHFHRADVLRMLGREAESQAAAATAQASKSPAGDGGFASLDDPIRDEVALSEGVTTRLLLSNARKHLAAGRRSAALEALGAAVKANPDSIEIRLDASRMLAEAGAYEQAAVEAERAVVLDGSRADSYAQLGEVLGWAGRREQGVQALRRALEIDPDLHEARAALGLLLAEGGEVTEGIALLEQARAARPANADVAYNLAAMLVKVGRIDQATRVAEELTRAAPSYAPSYALLGTIHAMAGRLEPSVASLRRAIELAPEDADAHMELGRSLWELRRYREAIEAYEQAAARRPRDPEIARELALSLATSPDPAVRNGARALALAQQLCESSRFTNPMHLETLAAAQAATGSFDAAQETAGRALTLVEQALAGLDAAAEPGERDVLREFAQQMRTRQARYREHEL